MGRLYVCHSASASQHNNGTRLRTCTRCYSYIVTVYQNTIIGGISVQGVEATLCRYCTNYAPDEISLYMSSKLTDEGVFTCMIVPQLKIIASVLIRTATFPRGELETILDILSNRIPPNIRLRNIYTTSPYVLFCCNNMSRIRGNSRYMNQDHLDELCGMLGAVKILRNRDRDMLSMLELCLRVCESGSNIGTHFSDWNVCKFV